MRLWSLHPQYLDPAGLVAVWREGLLARAVLAGQTKGYKHHPQLQRFRDARVPLAAIDTYLAAIATEADRRGYHFDRSRLGRARTRARIHVTRGQLAFEFTHLSAKLRRRRPSWLAELPTKPPVRAHPLFRPCPGAIEAWEKR